MKTYFHYIMFKLKEAYRNDPLNIIMPIWFVISFSVMFGGLIMFMSQARPNNFEGMWWLIIVIAGALSNPLIAAPILNWVGDRYQNYKTWKDSSNSDNKKQGEKQ